MYAYISMFVYMCIMHIDKDILEIVTPHSLP